MKHLYSIKREWGGMAGGKADSANLRDKKWESKSRL